MVLLKGGEKMKRFLKGFGMWLFQTVLMAIGGIYIYAFIVGEGKWLGIICLITTCFVFFLASITFISMGKDMEKPDD